MRKVLCSIGAGPHQALLALTRATFEAYAQRHGYDLVLHTRALDQDRPAAWSKIRLLRQLLSRYDLLLWVDADAVIVDHEHDIAERLEQDKFFYLVEHQYTGQQLPNTGVLMVRACDQADALLSRVWKSTDLIYHHWWENAAVMRVLGYEPTLSRLRRPTRLPDGVKLLDRAWNSIPEDPSLEPKIKHYPGRPVAERLRRMQDDVRQFWRRAGLQDIAARDRAADEALPESALTEEAIADVRSAC